MLMRIAAAIKDWNVPIVGTAGLAASAPSVTVADSLEVTKGVLQILLLIGTIGFTTYQGLRARVRWKREKNLEKLLEEAHHECSHAKTGHCPLARRLDSYDDAKT